MKKKVLLVDDDENIHRIHHYFLRDQRFRMYSAYSGEEGLKMARELQPDVILLDFMMPVMNGEAFLHAFRNDPLYEALQDVPIVMLTAASHERAYVEKLLGSGLAAYLRKPFGDSELIDVLENVLVNHRRLMENAEILDFFRESTNFLGNIMRNFPGIIFTTDLHGHITYYTEGNSDALGHSPEQLHGKPFLDICVLGQQMFHDVLSQLRAGELIVRQEVEMIDRKGRELPFELMLCLFDHTGGGQTGLLCIARDLSIAKALERERIERERVTAIAQTMATVNHEINNPLTPILGNIQLLLEESRNLPEDFNQRLESIRENAERIQRSVQKMRSISKPIFKEYYRGELIIDVEKSE